MATPQQIASNQAAKRLKQQAAQLSSEQFVDAPTKYTASNPIGLISQGLNSLQNTSNNYFNRNTNQSNLDRANTLKADARAYERSVINRKLTQADRVAANQEAFRAATLQNQADNLALNQQKQGFDEEYKNRTPADKFKTIQGMNGAHRIFNETQGKFIDGTVEQIGNKTGSYAQIKDTNNNVIGSFNNQTGKPEFFDGIAANDSINSVTGKPKSWGKAQITASQNSLSSYITAGKAINIINNIDEGDIANAAGGSSFGGAWTSGTRTSVGKFNQLLGAEFLGNVQQLKGLGSLSNAEGSKVTNAANFLVDPETNTLRTNLDENRVKMELQRIKSGYQNMQRIAEFTERNGREPTIKQYRAMTPVLGKNGNEINYGGSVVTEADITQTMKDMKMSRVQILNKLQGE